MTKSDQNQPTNLASGIASAPGDLPMPAVLQRQELKATQFRHDNTINPNRPRANKPVAITATSGAGMNIQRAEIWYTTDESWPDGRAQKISMKLNHIEWSPSTSYLNEWEGFIPPQPVGSVVRYKIAGYSSDKPDHPDFFAHDGSGFWFNYGEDGLTTFAYRVFGATSNFPSWMDDAVIYHIFLDRFRTDAEDGGFPQNLDPQEKHGGTLRGVINAIPYLEDLGVNCLWLSPIGPASTYHRYDQSDFFAVDADLGGIDTMHELVDAAHSRGIRLILDYVPSHGSWHMPEFIAAREDKNAPTASWFVFEEWPDKYRCFLGVVPFLVSFNSNDDGLRKYLIDSARYWLCDVGFDGLRLDHTIGHGSDFWVAFSSALERAKPDVAIFGEATDTPEMLRRYQGKLQGILDFPLAQILRLSFGRGDWGVGELSGALRAYHQYMAEGPGRVTFFDNHDMNRLLFIAGDDTRKLKLASICLFTLPFTPALYYGTEIGLSQNLDKHAAGFGGDSEVRHDMIWNPADWDQELLNFFKSLIGLRQASPALRKGAWQPVIVDITRQLYAYQLVKGSEEIQVFFNMSEETQHIDLEIDSEKRILLTSNAKNNLQLSEKGATIVLQSWSGIIAGKG